MTQQSALMGEDRLMALCNEALDLSAADQTQISISGGEYSLTRFASSVIHQNVSESNYGLAVKVAIGKRLGFATTNQIDGDSIRNTIETAASFARSQPENPDFLSLPEPPGEYLSVKTWFDSTASTGPDQRAQAVALAVEAAQQGASALASGSYSISVQETAIVNSLGIRGYCAATGASFIVVSHTDNGVSYAERHSRDSSAIDAHAAAAEASERCRENVDPIDLEAGEYDVVLLPYAVGDLLGTIGWNGFSAMALQEGRSFLTGKMGEKLVDARFSLWDDGTDAEGFARPMDGEGVPKSRVDLIREGIAAGVVYDSYTAYKDGRESTGHGSGGPGSWGPYPSNMFVATGDQTVEQMIAGTERGILVTRFHYTNILQEALGVITGMTRDGTFLIENGKVTKPVKNLRFTESVVRAFTNLEALGTQRSVFPHMCVPAAKIRDFRFTSATEF